MLRAEHVTKEYAKHRALSDVSMNVPAQSIFGLLGPNGAGKTTFIRIINQIIGADGGTIWFNNEPLKPKHVQYIGYLPEERGLYKKMKVGEQALYLARLKGLKRNEALKKLKDWFERFDLLPWWDKKVEELSKGMQQKVQFIITVLHNPRLLIFDEPFSGFDPINVNILKEEILKLRRNGSTIIFSTHNMGSVEELCDHIALINKSEKILEGEVHQIKKAYKSMIYEAEVDQLQKPLTEILDRRFTLIRNEKQNGIRTIRIQINENNTTNDLIETLLPVAHLLSFRELTPSMNDIFIKKVTGKFPLESTEV
ncbi:MAG: ATP-binding cassette domain-containing protein [Bacteroidia bacterium]|nr:MAG: ATP-binding cassette domain-containing protein [Bacteroidia bacterium]